MKTKELILAIMLLFFAGSFFSCQKAEEFPKEIPEEIPEDDPEEDDPEDFISEITMTAKGSTLTGNYPYGYFGLFIWGGDTTTIDWGDTTPIEIEPITSFSNSVMITHIYPDTSVFYTIKITGKNITGLSVGGLYGLNIPHCNYYIANLDVRKAKALTFLSCSHHPLTCLDFSKNKKLQELYCNYNNQLTSLDLSKNIELKILWCDRNRLTNLDIRKNTKLQELHCENNSITALNLSKHTELTRLVCYNNQLTSLDVSKNTKLTLLGCNNNLINALNLSNNPELQSLICDNNQLTSLNMSKNPNLSSLNCRYNKLSSVTLNALFRTLRTFTGMTNGDLRIKYNPGTENCDISIAMIKGWDIRFDY